MRTTFCLGASMVIFLNACVSPRFINSPVAMNNPVFAKQGDTRIAAFYSAGDGTGGETNVRKTWGFDLQAASAIGKRFLVLGGYNRTKELDIYNRPGFGNSNQPFDSATVNYTRSRFEAGAGFFLPITDREKSFFKFIAGYGSGKNSMTDVGNSLVNGYTRSHENVQRKLFFQTGFDFRFSPVFNAFVAGKRSFNWYSNIVTSYSAAELTELSMAGLEAGSLGFTELGWGLSCGLPKLPGLQVTGLMNFVTFNNNTNADGRRLRSRTLNASIGISYTFSALKSRSQ